MERQFLKVIIITSFIISGCQQIPEDILNAFNQNPYSHSLNSVA